MQQRTMIISNRLGLHARAAAKMVRLANGFESEILLARSDMRHRTVDAKSIISLLLLAASQGTMIELIIDGSDETDAMEALCRLIEEKFGED